MSIQNEFKALLYVIPRMLKDFWDHERNVAREYTYGILVTILLFGVGIVGFWGYRWYSLSYEQTAQRVLAADLEEVRRIDEGSKEAMPAQLAQLESMLGFDYEQHRRSGIAPLFLLVQADVQLQQGKEIEAVATLQRVIDMLPVNAPLLAMVKTKHALIQLDSADASMQAVGLQTLTALALDTKNLQSDLALFYLGRYYWAQNQLSEAKEAWQKLLSTPAYTGSFSSPWVSEARAALAQMSE